MMHKNKGRRLGRRTPHRIAMTRNLVRSLFTYGRVVTTLDRAKDMRRYAEKMVTLAKKVVSLSKTDGLAYYRRIVSYVGDRQVAKKIVTDIADRFKDRNGGYTRIIKLGGSRWDGEGRGKYAWNRLGDCGQRVFFELVERKEREEEMMLAGRGFQARQAMKEARKAKKGGTTDDKKKKKKK